MPWWNRGKPQGPSPEEAARRLERQQASIRALEAGELPLEAADRLSRAQSTWTSTLTTSDFWASRRLGLRAVGQVMGSSVFHASFNSQWLYGAWQNGDVRPLTQATRLSRDAALERLQQEAAMLGAHGVVAVRVNAERPEWGSALTEFTAMGTAVVFDGMKKPERPFLGTMSAQETLLLAEAGYLPLNIVYSTTAYYVMTSWGAEMQEMSWYNQEVPGFSRSTYEARDFVVAGLREQAREVAADGVLGADWDMHVEEIDVERPAINGWGGYGDVSSHRDHILYITVLGTAIGRMPSHPVHPKILPVLSVKDRPGVESLDGENQANAPKGKDVSL